eukprot:s109_g21.t1
MADHNLQGASRMVKVGNPVGEGGIEDSFKEGKITEKDRFKEMRNIFGTVVGRMFRLKISGQEYGELWRFASRCAGLACCLWLPSAARDQMPGAVSRCLECFGFSNFSWLRMGLVSLFRRACHVDMLARRLAASFAMLLLWAPVTVQELTTSSTCKSSCAKCAGLAMFEVDVDFPPSGKLPGVSCHVCTAALSLAVLGFFSYCERSRRYLQYIFRLAQKLSTKLNMFQILHAPPAHLHASMLS